MSRVVVILITWYNSTQIAEKWKEAHTNACKYAKLQEVTKKICDSESDYQKANSKYEDICLVLVAENNMQFNLTCH